MPIDHVMLKVKDWPKAKAYYTTVLKPLGYEPVADWGTGGGFGVPGTVLGNIYVKQGEIQMLLSHGHKLISSVIL